MMEYTESGSSTTPQWSKTYIYLGARLLSTLTPNGSGDQFVQYHHPDRLGTQLVTNAQDTSYFEQQTLPFGTALNESPPSGGTTGSTNRRFTSYDRSATTGLDYAINRHDDAQQGRFTQVDPIGMDSVSLDSPQTLNLYAYCTNDPINHTDPSGLGFFSFLKNVFVKVVHALKAALAAFVFAFVSSGGDFSKGRSAAVKAFVSDFAFSVRTGRPGTPQWNPNSVSILRGGPSALSRYIINNFSNLQGNLPKLGFEVAYLACLGSLGNAPAPGLVQSAYIIQAADTAGTDRSLLAITWLNEGGMFKDTSLGFNTHPTNFMHTRDNLIGDIGPGQLFPGIWDKVSGGLPNPFGTNREIGQVFNGSVIDNLVLAARALGSARGQQRAAAAAIYRAGSPSGAGYGERIKNFNKHAKGYDGFFGCLSKKGF